jgi:predicted kinase
MEASTLNITDIDSFEVIPNETTYDLTIEQNANFYLATSKMPILVHNSGKSTFVKKYLPNLEKEKIFRIDADEIRTMLPEYKGWNSKATHKETQDIYKGLLQDVSDGKPCRFDILWDGTMNRAENYLPLIGDLRKLNYQIYMINVKVPWDVSRKRTLDRYVKASTDGKYGRYVPMAVVDEANKNGGKAFEDLKLKADGYMVVDGVTTQIIEKGGTDILADRGYFDKEPTEKDAKLKLAKAKLKLLELQRKRIAIKLGLEAEKKPEDSSLTPIEKATERRHEFNASIITSVAPYKEAFLKRKGLSYNDQSKLTKSQKDKLASEWLKSQEYDDMQNRDKKEIWEKYNN